MAAKRFFDGDEDQPNQKRMKSRPSFASVIREVVTVNFCENFCSALEPMLRKVVSEEVENGLRRHCMSSTSLRYPSMRMISSSSSLQFTFAKNLSLSIFTSTKIVDADANPLQIILHQTHESFASIIAYPIKVELVVLDGDFPNGDEWTKEEFARNIVKERSGKRPLLIGDLNIIIKDGGIAYVGNIEFTDNSSWIRSRKFRLGARLVNNATEDRVIIREAITQAFVVKDHRGELYKKHYPPALSDPVWRLEKIGKDGIFHQKLVSHDINTVQDLLKLFIVDSSRLRNIVGVGMSEKMWEATLKHAKSCVMGTTVYRCHGHNFTLTFNPICQLIKAVFDGQVYYQRDLKRIIQTEPYIHNLVKDAYAKWHSLEVLEELVHDTPLLTQGEMVGLQVVVSGDTSSCSVMQNNEGEYNSEEWLYNFTNNNNICEPKTGIRFFSETSSQGEHDMS